jgi:glutathione S-transferase
MYQLYLHPYSQHSRRVVSLLEEAGLEYEPIPVDLLNGEHLSAQYLAINPNHQVPALIDGETRLYESNAILRYLCVKNGLTDWYPEDLPARAAVEQWLDWTQCRLGPAVVSIVFNRVFLGDKGDQEAIARGLEQMVELSAILEKELEGKVFLAGDRPGIADLALASNMFQLGLAGEIPDTENIQNWYARVCELKGFQKSLPTE